MKKLTLSLITSIGLLSGAVNADEKYYGFSYAGFGVETASYEEVGVTADGKKFKSAATSSAPVYTSGSLIFVNSFLDFSIDAASTLMATQSDEKWQQDGYVVQKNKYDSVQSDLKFLLHYKFNSNHRVVFGPNYNLFTMKRHTYTNPADGSVKLQNGNPISLNQEDVATLNMMFGYWYEYAPFSNGGMRVKAAALYGNPIWNSANNTSSTEVSFSSTTGSTLNLNGYVGFEVTKGLEMGLFAGYTVKKKDGDNTKEVGADTVSWPENELQTFRYGVSFAWNFDVK